MCRVASFFSGSCASKTGAVNVPLGSTVWQCEGFSLGSSSAMRPGVRRMLESKMVESVECMSYRVLDVVRRKRGSEVFVTIQLIPAKGEGFIPSRQLYPSNGIQRGFVIWLRVELTRRYFSAQQRCSSVMWLATLPPHASPNEKLFAAIPSIEVWQGTREYSSNCPGLNPVHMRDPIFRPYSASGAMISSNSISKQSMPPGRPPPSCLGP